MAASRHENRPVQGDPEAIFGGVSKARMQLQGRYKYKDVKSPVGKITIIETELQQPIPPAESLDVAFSMGLEPI